MKRLTLVIPCYNEEESLPILYKELQKISQILSDYEIEYIFVDDGSKDKTLRLLRELAQADSRVKFLSFSRNFGKEAAIYAGLSHCSGDYIALLDADMQDPPGLLPEMLQILENNEDDYDCVATRRVNRDGEPPIRSWFAKMFYKIINKLSDIEIADGARDFRLMKKYVVDSIVAMKEYHRFSKGIFAWVGFKTKWLEYKNVERSAGATKWSFRKLLSYSIGGIIDFSTAPLKVAAVTGILFFIISMIFIVVIVVRTFLFGDSVAGWPSLVSIILMIGGIQLFCIGILGSYLAKTYLEIKNRPIFLLKETNFKINRL